MMVIKELRKNIIKALDAKKRKPAFNHPDHAGLSPTSIVTSLNNQTRLYFPSYGVLSFCHPDMSLCRAAIMRLNGCKKNIQFPQQL